MAALHQALKSLGPVKYDAEVPTAPDELEQYMSKVFEDAQLVLDTIPISKPDDNSLGRARSQTISASSSSEMLSSSARSEPPAPDRIALQKEWGKPIKLGQKENSMGMSVYKASGKDGKGAWFARRSVHEGLGFDRFVKAFEKEFPTSLAVHGAPGEGNIRGIGAETRVEDKSASHARMQVYRLSAQFPGPTTPRDFVTLLLTSPKALKPQREGELIPRHYMIVSKPCDHPETQPRNGFIRGQYESVEFIREIPRKLTASTSTTDLSHLGHKHGHNLEQDVLIHNAAKRASLHPEDGSHAQTGSRDVSPSGRKRSHTVDLPEAAHHHRTSFDEYDPDQNPVEWIMVTRSDPGGSVPRFMVERGTPASICADAVKFLDWACVQDESAIEDPETPQKPPAAFRRESFTSFAHEKSLSEDHEETSNSQIPHTTLTEATPSTPNAPQHQTGFLNTVAGAVSAYAPQALQGYLPHPQDDAQDEVSRSTTKQGDDDDASSTLSSLSFASADSHLSRDLPTSPTASMNSSLSNNAKPQTAHEKELAKLNARRAALESKHAANMAKLTDQKSSSTAKEEAALKRAEEKHARDLKKQEERYQRELEKLNQRKEREEKKAEQKKKRQADKDEKDRFKRERDELKEKLEVAERERDVFVRQVGELQKENTLLVARIGKLEAFRNSSSDLLSKDSDSAKSGSRLSRSATPTQMASASTVSPSASMGSIDQLGSQQSLRPGLSEHSRTLSDDGQPKGGMAGIGHAMDQFGNRMKTATFHTFGVHEKEGEGNGNRNRSGSLFRRSREGATTPTPEKIRGQGS